LILALAVSLGIYLDEVMEHLGIHLPLFVTCLFGGILLTNTLPLVFKNMRWPTGTPTLALISDIVWACFWRFH